ncbi:MAG: DUF6951 family protein [Chloroflexota bacterium]
MTKAEVFAGVCGFTTTIEAVRDGRGRVRLHIQSGCTAVQRLARELDQVDPFREIAFGDDGPETLRVAARCQCHTACPVPAGIIKTVEVEAGLALPADAIIRMSPCEDGNPTA